MRTIAEKPPTRTPSSKGQDPGRKIKAPRTENPELLPKPPEVYYDDNALVFWMRTPSGEFVRLNKDGLSTRLHQLGFSTEREKGLPSQVLGMISDIRMNQFVRWAGPLAGHWAGRYVINGRSILVTESPRVIKANPNYSDSTIYDYFQRLFGDEQAVYFHAWIKLGREAFLSKSLRRAPAMIVVGKHDHGKSLGGDLVSLMLGGRQADPTQFAQGETTFNAHLFGAEFLFADDKGGGRDDHRAQLRTASVIKQLVGNRTPECHGKQKTPLGLTPFWRVMYALNDEPEDLLVLPALSDGIMDKLIIFKTVARAIDVATDTDQQFKAYEAKLHAAIPDYLGWLEQWEIPAEHLHGRFGQTVYHNPEVLKDMQQFTPETKLLQLIDEYEFPYGNKHTAKEIESMLKEQGVSPVEQEARNLLRRPGSCGKFLTRLCKRQPERVHDAGRYHGGSQRYVISEPLPEV